MRDGVPPSASLEPVVIRGLKEKDYASSTQSPTSEFQMHPLSGTQDLPIMPYLIFKIPPYVSIVKSTAKNLGRAKSLKYKHSCLVTNIG